MDEKIQAKIDKILESATTPVPKDTPVVYKDRSHLTNNLSRAIRTPEDAAKFMAELEAIRMYLSSK